MVSGDPHQLMQVFLNLVLNAEQAIREARDRGTLRIRVARASSSVTVVFQDDGPGIAPEILPNIFDPFYTTKRPGRGTGLGLSICKAILREHGGNVEAASAPGGGAVFTVSLPIASGATASTASGN
jgi:signal transduction histidine kinase